MRLLLLGATGRTGAQILDVALGRGHQVTAYVRSPHKLGQADRRLAVVRGDPLNTTDLAAAMTGHDAVISALGLPPREALRPSNRMAEFAGATVAAMQMAAVHRLAIVSAAVLFPLTGPAAMFFRWLLRHHARDLAAMETVVEASPFEWTIARPGRLVGSPEEAYRWQHAAFPPGRLVGLAYRMLGDIGRAEDMVQDAWLRWEAHADGVESPQAFLVTVVTRLCLNELTSARARREETRSDRLPEPIDLDEAGIVDVERAEQVSMAFLVALQRLTPAERAVLLLHEVFDFDHPQIAALVGTTAPASRKLLERARRDLATERRLLEASSKQHERLLEAFLHAVSSGDVDAVVRLLAEDAVLVTDGGPDGRSVAGRRNLPRPLEGAGRIAAFILQAYNAGERPPRSERRDLNGQPAVVFWAGDQVLGAMLLAIAGDRIARVYFHADASRLRHAARH